MKFHSEKLKKIAWASGRNAFWIILICVLFELAGAFFLVWQFTISADSGQPGITPVTAKFDNDSYQKVLDDWKARDQDSSAVETEYNSDPFEK